RRAEVSGRLEDSFDLHAILVAHEEVPLANHVVGRGRPRPRYDLLAARLDDRPVLGSRLFQSSFPVHAPTPSVGGKSIGSFRCGSYDGPVGPAPSDVERLLPLALARPRDALAQAERV